MGVAKYVSQFLDVRIQFIWPCFKLSQNLFSSFQGIGRWALDGTVGTCIDPVV
ncbi:hypothetical protein X975_15665, partial [Stegodyphus mimosarum]